MDKKTNTGKEMIRRIIKYRYDRTGFHPGKMYVQKILFIAKVLGEKVPYDYSLYTYGPYSKEIMDDLDDLESMGEVSIEWNSRFEGYEIINKDIKIDEDISFDILGNVLEEHGDKNAKSLELLSTILYLFKDYPEKDDLFRSVKEVKPMFEDERIERTIDLINEMDLKNSVK